MPRPRLKNASAGESKRTMKRTRFLAYLLTLATTAYLLFAWLRLSSHIVFLSTLGLAAGVLLLGSLRKPQRDLTRWLLPLASALYAFLTLIALALHIRLGLPFSERAALPAFLIMGLALSLRSAFQATRPARHRYSNYFDSPQTQRLSDQRQRSERKNRP